MRKTAFPWLLSVLLAPALLMGQALAPPEFAPIPEIEDPFAKTPTLEGPSAEELKTELFAWLKASRVEAEKVAEVEKLWAEVPENASSEDLHQLLCKSLAQVDERFAKLYEYCGYAPESVILPEFAWLEDKELPPFVKNNLALLWGRWLAREAYYDEAENVLSGLDAESVADPASLLFYQGVAAHRLLKKEPGLSALDRLLDDVVDPPNRYVQVALLMRHDLANLREETLDHISRQMEAIETRLDKGHAGDKVKVTQKDVVDALQKMIAKLEEQQQQQGGGGGGGGGGQGQQPGPAGGTQSSSPASDSSAAGGSGAGNVNNRDIAAKAGWGNLPPKEQEKALQDVSKSYPSYYREVVQEYFRKRAAKGSEQP